MSILKIVTYPDSVLKQSTALVASFDKKLHAYLDDMFETMYQAGGIGLASPQVGNLIRVAVVDLSEDESERIELINPQIVARDGSTSSEEGCLSIPGYRDTLKRNKTVKVKAQDRSGKEFEIEAEGLLSMCLQHEIDHLDGILFVDRLSRLKRELFRRWYLKQVQEGEYPGQ